MKIKFVKRHHVLRGDGSGPVYNPGDVVDFDGHTAETYARKYIARGWAVEHLELPEEVEAKPDFSVEVGETTPVLPPVEAEEVAAPPKPTLSRLYGFGEKRGPGRPRKT